MPGSRYWPDGCPVAPPVAASEPVPELRDQGQGRVRLHGRLGQPGQPVGVRGRRHASGAAAAELPATESSTIFVRPMIAATSANAATISPASTGKRDFAVRAPAPSPARAAAEPVGAGRTGRPGPVPRAGWTRRPGRAGAEARVGLDGRGGAGSGGDDGLAPSEAGRSLRGGLYQDGRPASGSNRSRAARSSSCSVPVGELDRCESRSQAPMPVRSRPVPFDP